MLKKYIVYARQNIRPKLQNMDQDKVAQIYGQLRQESLVFCIFYMLCICFNYDTFDLFRQREVYPSL